MEILRKAPLWSWAMVAIGVGLLGLSFVPGWLTHHRELQGEGYRSLVLGVTAWQLRSGSLPVLGGAVVAALAVGALAVGVPRLRAWLVIATSIPLGLLLAGLVPIAQVGHISRVWIGPGWTLLVAIAAVGAMATIALRRSRPTARAVLAAGVVLVIVGAGGAGARILQLELQEGASQHWSDGSYSRDDDATPPLVLTLRDGTFALAEWSGKMEPAGINVILTEDAACPEARGFYRVRSAGGDGVLWEKVVDVCADGDRAAALEGVWWPIADADS